MALSVQKLSNAFILCTFTTAIGFFAFVPTAYAGASELGIISGTGMFINLILNLTVLPASLNLIARPLSQKRALVLSRKVRLVPEKHARTIATGALILGIGAALLIPKVFFDNNPLNLSNPNAESVIIAKLLFKNGKTAPWRISVMADSLAEARALAAKLSNLEEVEMAITIADFIPHNQAEKIDIIADMTLFIPSGIGQKGRSSPSLEQYRSRLQRFRSAVDRTLLAIPEANHAFRPIIQRLQTHLVRLDALLHTAPESGHAALLRLDEGLLSNLSILLQNLEAALQPAIFSIPDLPEALRQSFVSDNAQHYRIEVFPHGNLAAIRTLERFVTAVRTIAPQATDAPVTILESGRVIVSAFWHASFGALAVIAFFLWMTLRKISEIILILLPLTLAVLLTGASTVLLDIPFNFANIIVVPLLLGTGVDYSIHLMHRFRTDDTLNEGLLATSTSRAVLFSALTTIVSFGSLSFLSHSGTASMGKLLTLCIFFTILSVLVVLPALLALNRRSRATLYGSR